MSKRASRGRKAVPVLGVAGLSLAAAGGASASTAPVADTQALNNLTSHVITEEEIADVNLSTFYVFDRESTKAQKGDKVAWWGRCRCGGCGYGCRRCWYGCKGYY